MSDLIGRLEAIGGVTAPGDWLDVVARAERLRSSTLRRRLIVAIAVALLAVPTIAIATGHWNLFSLTATGEEIPLPEGEAKLGYVVGDEVRLPGRQPEKLAGPVGAYLGSQSPLVVPSADGRTLVYHTWVRELDLRRGMVKSATNFLHTFDVETGRNELLERGAAAAAWRRDGALAYLRPTVPEFRNNLRGSRGGRFGHIVVRRSLDAPAVRWTTAEAAWVPLAWAGNQLLAQSTVHTLAMPDSVQQLPRGVWAFSGPRRGRPLPFHTLVAVSPDGRLALGIGSRDGSSTVLSVVEPETGRTVVSVTADDLPGVDKDGIDRVLVVPLGGGSWSGDTIIGPSGPGHAIGGVIDFDRPETLERESEAGLSVLRFYDGRLSIERTLKLTGAVAEATGLPYRNEMFEFIRPVFVDKVGRQFTSELKVTPKTGRPLFFFVTCDIVDERCRRGRLRKPFSTRTALVYNPSRPLPD
jgi:hypothetical protein